jgi:V/A-type H+-transporting ATPase subunit D
MSDPRLSPTRSSLLRTRRRLAQVNAGIDLLTRKRRALVADLFKVAAPAIEARELIQNHAAECAPALLAAMASQGEAGVQASGWPARRIEVEMEISESWGVVSAAVRRLTPVRRTFLGRGQAPALAGPAVAAAAAEFEHLVEVLIDAASTELRLRRIAEALARTSRQVNTLERRVAPSLERGITRVRNLLAEREREDKVRLKRLAGRRGVDLPPPPQWLKDPS